MRQLIFILLSFTLLSASCKKQEDLGEYYIRCKINGEPYWPNGCTNCQGSELLGDTVFMMHANADFVSVILGVIKKPYFTLGGYVLNSQISGGAYKNSTIVNDIFYTDSTHSGLLTITELDKSKQIIAGAFYFRAYNSRRDTTVNITQGIFRLHYIDY